MRTITTKYDEQSMGKRCGIIILVMVGFVAVLFAPALLTKPALCNWFVLDTQSASSIGDAIGGVTAPIVGLLSVILLCWTLNSQLDFNREQSRANKEQLLTQTLSNLYVLDSSLKICYTKREMDGSFIAEGLAMIAQIGKSTTGGIGCMPLTEARKLMCHMRIMFSQSSMICKLLAKKDGVESSGDYKTIAVEFMRLIKDVTGDIIARRIQILPSMAEMVGEAEGGLPSEVGTVLGIVRGFHSEVDELLSGYEG